MFQKLGEPIGAHRRIITTYFPALILKLWCGSKLGNPLCPCACHFWFVTQSTSDCNTEQATLNAAPLLLLVDTHTHINSRSLQRAAQQLEAFWRTTLGGDHGLQCHRKENLPPLRAIEARCQSRARWSAQESQHLRRAACEPAAPKPQPMQIFSQQ